MSFNNLLSASQDYEDNNEDGEEDIISDNGNLDFILESTADSYGPFVFSEFVTELETLLETDYTSSLESVKDEFFIHFFNILSKLPKGVQHGKFGLGNIRNDLLLTIFNFKSLPVVSLSGICDNTEWISDKDHKQIIFKNKEIKCDKWGNLRLVLIYI